MKSLPRRPLLASLVRKVDQMGPYAQAVAVLTIKDLFQMLPRRAQEDLLDHLVGIVIANDPADPANTVRIRGDHGGAPAASGDSEPCEGSRPVIHNSSP